MSSDLRFHHVGIACRNVRRTLKFITDSHPVKRATEILYDANQKADVCLVTLEDGTSLELVSGEIVANLTKKGMTYYHICYEVDDIDASVDRLTRDRCRLVSGPTEAILFDQRKVAFLYSPMGLIELLSRS